MITAGKLMVKNAVDKIPAPPPIIAIINTKGLIYVPLSID